MTPVPTPPRDELSRALGGNPRLVRAFEQQFLAVGETQGAITANVDATEALQDATFLTLSSNASLTRERVLRIGPGLTGKLGDETFDLSVSDEVPHVVGGFPVSVTAQGATTLVLPLDGVLATTSGDETLSNKRLASARASLGNYADDAAAAAGGVPVEGLYRTGSVVKVRVA